MVFGFICGVCGCCFNINCEVVGWVVFGSLLLVEFFIKVFKGWMVVVLMLVEFFFLVVFGLGVLMKVLVIELLCLRFVIVVNGLLMVLLLFLWEDRVREVLVLVGFWILSFFVVLVIFIVLLRFIVFRGLILFFVFSCFILFIFFIDK